MVVRREPGSGSSGSGIGGLDPDTDRLLRPSRPPTCRVIHVDRARRKVYVPSRTPRVRRRGTLALLGLDVVVGFGLLWGAPFVLYEPSVPRPAVVAALMLAAMVLTLFVAGGYRLDAGLRVSRWAWIGASLGLLLGWLGLKLVGEKIDGALVPPAVFGFLAATAILAATATTTRLIGATLLARGEARAKVFFIGDRAAAERLRTGLHERRHPNPFYHFDPGLGHADGDRLPLSALDARMEGAVKAVILGIPADRLPRQAVADLIHCRVLNVPVLTESQFVEELWQRVPLDTDDPAWALFDERLHAGRSVSYLGFKRVLDVFGALVGLVLAAPLLLLAAIAIKLESRGPVVFTQVRTGLWKQPFTIYKLRTMCRDAEKDGARLTAEGDTRVTRVGVLLRRTRVDEIPQLFNVLLGSMSLVGPRPERPELIAHYERQIPYYDLRHLVKPGITGWAQVAYRYAASLDDTRSKTEYDIFYVKHASVFFDARILARTVGVVLGFKGR